MKTANKLIITITLIVLSSVVSTLCNAQKVNGVVTDLNGEPINEVMRITFTLLADSNQVYFAKTNNQGKWSCNFPLKLPSTFMVNVAVSDEYDFIPVPKQLSTEELIILTARPISTAYSEEVRELQEQVESLENEIERLKSNAQVNENDPSSDEETKRLLEQLEDWLQEIYDLKNQLDSKQIDLIEARENADKTAKDIAIFKEKIADLERRNEIAYMIGTNFKCLSNTKTSIKFKFKVLSEDGSPLDKAKETVNVSIYRLKNVTSGEGGKKQKLTLFNGKTITSREIDPSQEVVLEIFTLDKEFFPVSNNYYIEVGHSGFNKPFLDIEINDLNSCDNELYPEAFAGRKNKVIEEATFRSGELNLSVYDRDVIDGDSLQIILNGLEIDRIEAGEQGTYNKAISLGNSENYLIFRSLNEGSMGENTINVRIYDQFGNDVVMEVNPNKNENAVLVLKNSD